MHLVKEAFTALATAREGVIQFHISCTPIILGGGTDVKTAASRLKNADGALVGRCFEAGNWGKGVNESIVATYMDEVKKIEG